MARARACFAAIFNLRGLPYEGDALALLIYVYQAGRINLTCTPLPFYL